MRPVLSPTLLLALPAHAKRPDAPTVPKVPSTEEVVAADGFTPTPPPLKATGPNPDTGRVQRNGPPDTGDTP